MHKPSAKGNKSCIVIMRVFFTEWAKLDESVDLVYKLQCLFAICRPFLVTPLSGELETFGQRAYR